MIVLKYGVRYHGVQEHCVSKFPVNSMFSKLILHVFSICHKVSIASRDSFVIKKENLPKRYPITAGIYTTLEEWALSCIQCNRGPRSSSVYS